jgi:hypothetical protein
MDIYYKSDFTITETFLDENGVAIDMTAIDFKIDYYTLSNTKYTASKTGAVYVNCEAGSTTNQLNVFFAKHGMPAGKLQREITLYITNPDFSPNQKVITNPVSDIILVAKGGDSATASASVVYPAIVVPPTYYDIKDLADSTGLRASWTAKIGIEDLQDATTKDAIIDADEVNYLDSANNFSLVKTTWLNIKAKLKTYFDAIYATINHNHNNVYEPANENIQSHIGDGDIHVTSLQKSDFHAHTNKTALDAVDGVNTGDQSSSDFDIKDLSDTTSLRSTWNAKQDALTFSTNIETDKASTTKVSAIKTFYDWAVGKFIDLAKIVTTWTATTLDTNIPSEKLVKDSLNLKADITPANGSTSALRALFIARGYDSATNTYHCVYNANTGYYEMNGLTDITEAEMSVIYNYSTSLHNANLRSVLSAIKCRTFYPLKFMMDNSYDISFICEINNVLVAFYLLNGNLPADIILMPFAFYGCTNLKIVNALRVRNITNAANAVDAFNYCPKLEECYLHNVKVAFSFGSSPLLSLASLQYLVTNRANGTSRITITVHPTVWGYLNDAVGHPTWNALLVDAVNNQYIDFASA